jgi:transposase InsO family protein
MVQLRRRRKAGWDIAHALDVPVSTVSKHLKSEGLGRIWRLEEALDPPKRYEHAVPGELLHIDAKRYARINGVRQRFTRPYTPGTNGKAERFIQTMKRRWIGSGSTVNDARRSHI